jgi:glycosyltransferase involved in cell wall biosynthesis
MKKKLKILLVSKYNYPRGGDCTNVSAIFKLLEEHGHEVRIFSMHHPKNSKYTYEKDFVSYIDFPEELAKKGLKSKIRAFTRMLYSKETRIKFKKILKEFKPDVIHMHNIHKHLTSSIILEANKQKIPVVWTLHDYNLICANISFLSNGKICERCKQHRYLGPLMEKCYKRSISASAILSAENLIYDLENVKRRISTFISPSKFLKNKFLEYGYPEDKIVVLPYSYPKNDTAIQQYASTSNKINKYYLYIGRLSPEKGIDTLCEAAKIAGVKLIIAGEGPNKEYLKSKCDCEKISFVGHKTGKELIELRKNAWFVVVPSEWYENYPFSIIESFSDAVPVIGANIGGIPELVKDKNTGYLFESKNVEQLVKILSTTAKMSSTSRNKLGEAAAKFIKLTSDPERYYKDLIKIYSSVIMEAK